MIVVSEHETYLTKCQGCDVILPRSQTKTIYTQEYLHNEDGSILASRDVIYSVCNDCEEIHAV